MSRGLSRQQVAILLAMRQREEECYRKYTDAPQTGPCRCGKVGRDNGYWIECYRCHLRPWPCKRCQPSVIDIVAHFWPKPPELSAETKARLEADPGYRAWFEGFQKLVAAMPRRRKFYVSPKHYVSVQRAMLGLQKRGLVSQVGRSRRGYHWATRWHPALPWLRHLAEADLNLNWRPRISVAHTSPQHLSGALTGATP